MVVASATGALPLLAIALTSPSFLRPGALPLLGVIVAFTASTVVVCIRVRRLRDPQFAVLGCGGMIGVAISAYLIADPVGTRSVTAMLAIVPAIAASGSPPRVTAALTVLSVAMATALSITDLSTSGQAVAGITAGAAATTVLVPVLLIAALRGTLASVNHRLEVLADTDSLTGLLNRRGMLSHTHALLDYASARSTQIAALVIDIDHFKKVNDNLGHAAGDRALVEVAEALGCAVDDTGAPGTVIARIGGEEFLLLSSHTPATTIGLSVLDRVRSDCMVTVSIGSVTADVRPSSRPRPGHQVADTTAEAAIDNVMRAADRALYEAKATGRDRICHAGTVQLGWSSNTLDASFSVATDLV